MSRPLAACAALASVVMLLTDAAAQPVTSVPSPPQREPIPAAAPSPDHQAQAQQLFEQGKVALEGGDWTAACAFFEASSALHEAPSVLVKLARCRVRDQRFAEAIRLHERALAQQPWPELDRLIRAELFEVQKKAPSFRVTLVTPSTGVTLRKDGVLMTSLSREPIWLDVGVTVHLDASADGYRGYTYDLVAAHEGEALEVRVVLAPEPRTDGPRAPSQTPAPPPPSPVQAIAGWTALGAGGTALTVGAIFGAQFLATKDDVYDDCSGTLEDGRRVCPASTALAQDDAIAARTRAQVLLSVGALVAAGGVVLLATQPAAPSPRSGRHGATAFRGVRIAGSGLEGAF